MRIDEARIDAYGEKSKLTFDFSRGPFYLAFGPNEAGKSSFLEFIRNLLFDLPPGGASSGPFFSGFGAATLGGSAKFRLADGRRGRVERTWKLGETRRRSAFAATLRSAETGLDAPLDEETFLRLLGGADRRLFATYFGFSYRELAQGEELLTETGISELIYGFGVGGPKAFNETKKSLKKELDAYFSASGNAKKQRINAAVRRLKDVATKMKGASGSAREYSELCKERDAAVAETAQIRQNRQICENERRDWEALREKRSFFDAAEAAAKDAAAFFEKSAFSEARLTAFPPDGLLEWRAISNALKQIGDEISALNEEAARSRAAPARIERFPKFLAEAARIRGASRRIDEIANERRTLPEDSARTEREAAELARRGAEIGVDAAAFRDGAPPIADAALDRANREAELERRLAEEARTAEKTARERRDEIAELERELETAETRRVAEFGEQNRVDDETDFARIDKAFPALRDAAERTARADAALSARRGDDEKTARRLIRTAFAAPSKSEKSEDAALLDALENANVPLAATLGELERTADEIERERTAARTETARLDDEIGRLRERLTAANDWNAASADELARRRRERAERWAAIKTSWLEPEKTPKIPASERAATVDAFERAVEKADALADSRFENAKSIAEWEAANRELAAKIAERAAVDERLRRADDAAAELAARGRALWRDSGLNVRADFSLAEAKEWRGDWENWAAARRETKRLEAELGAEKARLRDAARETASVAARWLDGDINNKGENGETAELVGVAARLLARAAVRVDRWRELNARKRDVAARLASAAEKLRRFELDAATVSENRAASDVRRREFLAELAAASIPVDANAARSFGDLAATLEKLRGLQAEARRLDGERARLAARAARISEFEREIGALATALDVGELDPAIRAEDAARVWADRLQTALDAENAWRAATENAERTAATLDAKKSAAAAQEARRKEALESVGATSETEFLALGAAAEEARKLAARRDETANLLRAALGGKNDDDFARNLDASRSVDGGEIATKIDDLTRKLAELDENEAKTAERLTEIQSKIRFLEEKEGATEFAVEREGALGDLREAVELFVPRLIACRALENSLRRCEEEKRPQILEDANEIFARLTSGRYSRIVAEKDSFEAIQRDGVAKSPRELSSGTREQLYLALRLAHIRRYCVGAEPLPLLTDDVLINFDDERAEETLRVLAEFAQNTQVILLTCRESTRRAFERVVGNETILELSGRKFEFDDGENATKTENSTLKSTKQRRFQKIDDISNDEP